MIRYLRLIVVPECEIPACLRSAAAWLPRTLRANAFSLRASWKTRLDRRPGERRGPGAIEFAGFRIKSGMTNRNLSKRLFRMILGAALAISCIVGEHVHAQTGPITTEKGVIREILDDKLYIEGETGLHILEPLGVCSWCEEDQSITIFFDTITKASIQPYPNPQRKRTVRAFILRDARLEF